MAVPNQQQVQPKQEGGTQLEIYEKLKQHDADVFYEKPLTTSDSNGAGRVVIPKQVAHGQFPHFKDHTPQIIQAYDTEGAHYELRFRFWVNGSSRMYLLEGLGELHRKFRLGTGDVMIFARTTEGKLLLAGRQGTKDDIIKKVPRHGRGEVRHKDMGEFMDHRGAPATKISRTASGKTPHGVLLFPDGVFRQLNSSFPPGIIANDIVKHNDLYFAGIDIDGEVYAGVFANQDDAMEAFFAAGIGEDCEAILRNNNTININNNNNHPDAMITNQQQDQQMFYSADQQKVNISQQIQQQNQPMEQQ